MRRAVRHFNAVQRSEQTAEQAIRRVAERTGRTRRLARRRLTLPSQVLVAAERQGLMAGEIKLIGPVEALEHVERVRACGGSDAAPIVRRIRIAGEFRLRLE